MSDPTSFGVMVNRRRFLLWMGAASMAALVPDTPVRAAAPALVPAAVSHKITYDALAARTADHPILLCDDTLSVLDLYTYVLRRTGFTTIATTNQYDALDLCRREPVSLVISDIMKPGMSGLEMLEWLRADPLTHDIPLIFLSARSDAASQQQAWELGADDYLIKPVLFDEYFSAVRRVLHARGHWR